ncbi:MAG: Lrp/AsnC family transcriptional regulator [Microbacteriaceae bacterium]
MNRLDPIDREILSLLQDDGRLSVTDLATQVGLSLSACHRRVKELEGSGAIERYRAVISPEALGLGFEALVFVSMAHTGGDTIEAFERAIEELHDITSAQRLFGDPDYLLHIRTTSLENYQALFDTQLSALPGVQRLNSTIVMKRFGSEGTLPMG